MKKKVIAIVVEITSEVEIKLAREIKEFMKKKGERNGYKLQESS